MTTKEECIEKGGHDWLFHTPVTPTGINIEDIKERMCGLCETEQVKISGKWKDEKWIDKLNHRSK